MYALIDCNNFYVSCERVFQPQLAGKPVVVLSNNDGCIISRSDEAKKIGIPMGAPEFKYREILHKNNITVFSSNYALYGDLSHRVMKILEQFCPSVEVYSIDEAFLNYQGVSIEDFKLHGLVIRERILNWLSIPTSIGFAPTKALAKVANKIARKFPKETENIHIIDNEEKRLKALKWTKIEDVWGIGFRLTKKMKAHNIHTAYDFTLPHNEAFIKKQMGVTGLRLKYELEGTPILEMEEPKTKKSIAITRSFEKNLYSFEDIKERISTFAMVCSEKLRAQQSCCHHIIIYLRKDKFNESIKNYNLYTSETLPFATNSGITLSNIAIKLLKEIYREGDTYKKAGVIVSEIIPQDKKQFDLFEEENPKHQIIMSLIDSVHKKTGKRKIKLANQDLEKTWKMKQNKLSKKYTTDINEIMIVKC